jgi:hypothetical protein
MADRMEEKIAKLLRLARNQGATEAEATAAAERAAALMRKHGIDIGQIALEEGGVNAIEVKSEHFESKLDHWRVNLAGTVARVSGGQMVYTRSYGKWHGAMEFFGPGDTATQMIKLYFYLEEQLDRLSLISAATNLDLKLVSSAKKMSWRRSYLWGLTARVCHRLEASAKLTQQESMALVPVNDAVADKMAEKYGEVKEDKTRVSFDPTAAAEGYRDGHMVSIGDEKLENKTRQFLEG